MTIHIGGYVYCGGWGLMTLNWREVSSKSHIFNSMYPVNVRTLSSEREVLGSETPLRKVEILSYLPAKTYNSKVMRAMRGEP